MRMSGSSVAIATIALLALAGCGTSGTDRNGGDTPSESAAPRSYPGLFPEYQGKFTPDHSGLGGQSNQDLSLLLPGVADFPSGGAVDPINVAAEDGSGLGFHGQETGQTRPEQCLYSPFGKAFSTSADGSDWNLYFVASALYRTGDDWIAVAINRHREGADVFALTSDWIKGCGTYDKASPSFDRPDVRNQKVTDTFGDGPEVDGDKTYKYESKSTPLNDDSADKPAPKELAERRIVMAEVRSVVFTVEGTPGIDQATLDSVLAKVIDKAKQA